MRERPIIFTGESVRAILAGRKTQTRRVIKPQPPLGSVYAMTGSGTHVCCYVPPLNSETVWVRPIPSKDSILVPCPFRPGDRLWVREAWRTHERDSDGMSGILFTDDAFVPIENSMDAADAWVTARNNGKYGERWRSPLFMPRWASRLVLEVISRRAERLHGITEADAHAEGCTSVVDFAQRWDRINDKRYPWASNPWVWVVELRPVKEVTNGRL